MLEPIKENHTHSIVLIGDFNPKIFHPTWFAYNNLITNGEASAASNDIKILHSDICIFELDWATIEVTRDRFKIQSNNQAFFQPIFDLVYGTFLILEHTPIRMLGINHELHYGIKESSWIQFYNRITPKSFWDDIFDNSKLQTIIVKDERKSGPIGYTMVKIEESIKIKGIYFEVNNHFEIKDISSKAVNAKEITTILKDNWSNCAEYSNNIVEKIWNK
jgi:hypothetical protein